MAAFFDVLLMVFYALIGLQSFYTGWRVINDRTHPKRLTTALFWGILGILFMLGDVLPHLVSGILVCLLGGLALVKGVVIGKLSMPDERQAEKESKRLGGKIFIPVLLLAIIALLIGQFIPESSKSVVGIAAVIATLIAWWMYRSTGKEILEQSDRMVQQMGTTGILPQLLSALGVIFTMAGVGDVIAQMISGLVPEGHRLFGVVAYVLGMVVFTMIMGNAFAAFTVITAGIGVPFVLAQGADPAIASALAMTAGYCGTLLTPMAGNFNTLPVALLEMKNPYGVILKQAPMALMMIALHIFLMYVWAF